MPSRIERALDRRGTPRRAPARTSSRMNGLRTRPSPCSPDSAPPNSSTRSATSLAIASNVRDALGGLQVDDRPDVQAADRRVRVDAGRGAVPRDDLQEPLDVVAQLLGRDRGVLDERDRLGVALHRHRQAERRLAQAPDPRLVAAGRARGGSDSRSRAPRRSRFERLEPRRQVVGAIARRTRRTAARRDRPR